jgi:Cof subfamily protein (haloacid dehalogenase superfamily)
MAELKLVALDLDGTVLDPAREVPIRAVVKNAVRRILDRGIAVTLATGRTNDYACVRALELGIDCPLVTGQGAMVAWPDGRVLQETLLGHATARRLVEFSDAVGAQFSLYLRQPDGRLRITLNRMVREPGYYLHLLGADTEVVADHLALLDSWPDQQRPVLAKIVWMSQDLAAEENWKKLVGAEVQIARSHPDLIEGAAVGVDKGTGLAIVLRHLGLLPENLLAIGDAENDLPMFALAGTAVAMGHAPERVRAAADWIAPSFEQDGVAAALDHYLP